MNNNFIRWALVYLIVTIPSLLIAQSELDVGDFNNSTAKFEGSIDHKAPMVFCYKYSVTQQIYTAEELSTVKDKELTQIQFRSELTPDYNFQQASNYKITVYLKEIDYDHFTKKEHGKFEWETVSDDDVYSNTDLSLNFYNIAVEGLEGDSIITIKLDKPFYYTGKNLLVMLRAYSKGDVTEEIYNDFYCYPANVTNKPHRTLYYADDNSDQNTAYPKYSQGALRQRACMIISYQDKEVVGIKHTETKLSLYPTYVKTHFTVNLNEQSTPTTLLQIYNINGQKVHTEILKSKKTNINISNLKSGIYFVKVNNKINKIIKN